MGGWRQGERFPGMAIAKSLSVSALIPQPLLPDAEYRWEKGSKVPLPAVCGDGRGI
jgi:hypothetical protein